MDIRYTTKLMYRQYVYQVSLDVVLFPKTRLSNVSQRDRDVALFDIKKWLLERCEHGYRTHASWRKKYPRNDSNAFFHVCHFNIYLRERSDFESFLNNHWDQAVGLMMPLNAEHEELLKAGTQVEIRDKLFYHRFRYRVNFRGGWGGNARKHIVETVRGHLHDPSKNTQDYFLRSNDCTLYLEHHHDLMAIKLTMGEMITRLTMVNTISEAGLV